MTIAPLLVLWVGSLRVLNSLQIEAVTGIPARDVGLSPGELATFLMLVPQFQTPLVRFADLNVVVQNSLAAMERIFELFDVAPEITDRPGAIPITTTEGHIRFERVWFGYEAEEPVLKDISLDIEPETTVALVGRSGSGKSTLASLIPRFYDIQQGQITLDGIDLRDLQVRSLRKQIGLVPQDVILFSGTVEENILYGRPGATFQEIVAAARAANAHDFIEQFPENYHTIVGEKGVGLSGGQKQRIAIARAFLKNPRILILDEATSALDSESENLISEALTNLVKGRTTLVIAHRLSTILSADKIVVLNEGCVMETGTHSELLQKSGVYARLCEEQFRVLFAQQSLLSDRTVA
jgi:ABC-type multidrug transport system fused ATPase/permease subunit